MHEAFLRLNAEKNHPWQNRTHFLAIAALSMRQILVQRARARARHAAKRGGDPQRITLADSALADVPQAQPAGVDVLALDAALERLA